MKWSISFERAVHARTRESGSACGLVYMKVDVGADGPVWEANF